jgi:hypothetical protein
MALRRSILDAVRGRAAELRGTLGAADARKLDEYLESVRAVERRIEFSERMAAAPAGAAPAATADYTERIRLLADMAVLAMQQDQTRIVTCMLGNEGSNRAYPEVGVKEGHHDVSHHDHDPAKLEKFARINRWQTQQLAAVLEKLAATDDGGVPLLDRTMVLFGGAIADGNRHNHDDLPVILAGGGALGLRHEAARTYAPGTPLCNLYLTMLGRMGVRRDRFGDSTGELAL